MTEAELTRSATAVRLGIDNSVASEHRDNLPRALALFGEVERALGCAVTLTSGYRSPKLNSAIKGSKTSAHCLCLAIDIEVAGVSNFDICNKLAASLIDYDQIIYEFGEDGWVHIGLSGGPSRKQLLTAIKIKGKTVYRPGIVRA